jgi:hypothetical protein
MSQPVDLRELNLFTVEGHDRDAARAMLSQSRLRDASRIDDIQVHHLLQIGYRAGRAVTVEESRFDRLDAWWGRFIILLLGLTSGLLLAVLTSRFGG